MAYNLLAMNSKVIDVTDYSAKCQYLFVHIYFFGVVRLCGVTGTVFGPGFGASGFFLGVGDGVDLL
jgi:hypothetical protein